MNSFSTLRTFATAVCMTFCGSTLAQEVMEVVSFKRVDNDLRAQVSEKRYDDDGDLCALVIVETNLKDIAFDPDGRGIIERVNQAGEIWIFLPYGARQIYIKHQDYYPIQYVYEKPIERGVVYRLRLKTYSSGESMAGSNQQLLVIHPQPADAHVFIDNQEMEVRDGSVSMMMQKGEHLYRVEAPEYESQSGTISLADEMVSKTVALKPLFGYLEVLTQPEDSFQVYVNDSLIGYSPIRDYRLPIDEYLIHLEKDEFKPHDAKFGIFSGRTSHEQYTLITTRKPEGFPIRLSLEYLYSKTSYHGVRVAYGGRFGGYLAYKWGKYFKAGTNIDDYTYDTDVSHAKKLGYIRRAYTGGIRLGLVKKKLPLYAYLGGGYGEYGRQWENLTEINKNIYFHSDYLRGFEGEIGLSCVLFDWVSISAGTSALFAKGKMSVDFQVCAGLSLNQTKLFKRKKKK